MTESWVSSSFPKLDEVFDHLRWLWCWASNQWVEANIALETVLASEF